MLIMEVEFEVEVVLNSFCLLDIGAFFWITVRFYLEWLKTHTVDLERFVRCN